ncbi:MAG: hypothetical protein LC630_02800 [Bacteroidales bacterium]|nr:hypothetical protein [Bacteroidales bacterium]
MKKFILTAASLIISVHLINSQDLKRLRPTLNYDWTPGIVNILDAGYGFRVSAGTGSDYYFGITNITGYQFNSNHVKAGIGYGLWKYSDELLLPLFFDTRVNITSDYFRPFASLSGGAAFSTEDFTDMSKIFINPALGVRWVAMSKVSFNLTGGILFQSGGTEGSASFINFRLGVEFKGRRLNF